MKITNKVLLSAALIAAGGLAAGPAALATTMSCTSSPEVCISVGTVGNIVATSTTGTSQTGSYGVWNFSVNAYTQGSGLVLPPEILNSQTIDATSSASGSLMIWVTTTGVTGPLSGELMSSLTSQILPGKWSVSGQTYYDASNTAFAETALLSDLGPLTAIGTDVGVGKVSATGPYSLTEVYTISAVGKGNSSDTLDIQGVPEPGTLALFGAGLLGCALLVSRRRRTSQPRV